jgi:hypothetical protein
MVAADFITIYPEPACTGDTSETEKDTFVGKVGWYANPGFIDKVRAG